MALRRHVGAPERSVALIYIYCTRECLLPVCLWCQFVLCGSPAKTCCQCLNTSRWVIISNKKYLGNSVDPTNTFNILCLDIINEHFTARILFCFDFSDIT